MLKHVKFGAGFIRRLDTDRGNQAVFTGIASIPCSIGLLAPAAA